MRRALLAAGVLVVALVLSGCERRMSETAYVKSRYPVLPAPTRPALEKMAPDELTEYLKLPESARKKLEGNNDKLQIFGQQCYEAIKEYNGFARISNDLSDQALGIKPEGKPAP